MKDIVERIREAILLSPDSEVINGDLGGALALDAADEIERLLCLLREIREQQKEDFERAERLQDEIVDLRAKCDRQQRALNEANRERDYLRDKLKEQPKPHVVKQINRPAS